MFTFSDFEPRVRRRVESLKQDMRSLTELEVTLRCHYRLPILRVCCTVLHKKMLSASGSSHDHRGR